MLLTQVSQGVKGLQCCWMGSCRTHKHEHTHTYVHANQPASPEGTDGCTLSIPAIMLHFLNSSLFAWVLGKTSMRLWSEPRRRFTGASHCMCVFTRASVGACMCSSDGQRPFMLFSCLHSGAAAEINIVRGEILCMQEKQPQEQSSLPSEHIWCTNTHQAHTHIQSNLESVWFN